MGPRFRGLAGAGGRATLLAAWLGASLALSLAGPYWAQAQERAHRLSPLHSETVAVAADGSRRFVTEADLPQLVPGTRALDPVTAAGQQAWLAAGRVPGADTRWADMTRLALLDLHVLTTDDGAVAAGWSTNWRYAWPRDSSFVAAAYAAAGHPDDAERVLAYLQRVQPASGRLQARYLLDGSGDVPDLRGEEPDGVGWVLWAAGRVSAALPDPSERAASAGRLHDLLTRSTRACLDALGADGLPEPGMDYWEVPTRHTTLGLAAPVLAGLEAAPDLLRAAGEPDLAERARAAAVRLDRAIGEQFGSRDYPRAVDGERRDAALTFLFPPFRAEPPSAGLVRAWQEAQRELRRPAGGLAPGATWRDDGVSWTPQTALFALSAAGSGRSTVATHWLDWLDAHRTAAGSLSEKVVADGSPGAVAPLAWTSALVVLAVAAQTSS
jgi:GH15 family glucan-1,4-alpha-glucosidase